jgi:hypothetical protein
MQKQSDQTQHPCSTIHRPKRGRTSPSISAKTYNSHTENGVVEWKYVCTKPGARCDLKVEDTVVKNCMPQRRPLLTL